MLTSHQLDTNPLKMFSICVLRSLKVNNWLDTETWVLVVKQDLYTNTGFNFLKVLGFKASD